MIGKSGDINNKLNININDNLGNEGAGFGQLTSLSLCQTDSTCFKTHIIYQRCIDNDHVNDNANGNVNQFNVKVIDDVNIHVMGIMDNRL